MCLVGGDNSIDKAVGKGVPSIPNEQIRNDEERVFGLTTQQLNVKDNKDFEQITSSFETVTPSRLNKEGIVEEDYLQQRTRDEVRELLTTIGVNYNFAKFEAVWTKALSYENSTNPFQKTASLNSVMLAIRDVESFH